MSSPGNDENLPAVQDLQSIPRWRLECLYDPEEGEYTVLDPDVENNMTYWISADEEDTLDTSNIL